MAQIKAK
jgi:hypothetical protein